MPRIYAYIDESGDEGFTNPYADLALYRDRSVPRQCPSPFFLLGAVLLEDADRPAAQVEMRAIAAAIWPKQPLTEIHWRKLTPALKSFTANALVPLRFTIIAAVAHKPSLPAALSTPFLYNYMVKLVLERACLEANACNCTLLPTFSSRSRTKYADLEQYINTHAHGYGALHRLEKFRMDQPNRERLLQLADICCGALDNALEVDKAGKIELKNLAALWPKMRKRANRIRNVGLKLYPDSMPACGPASAWLSVVV